MPDNWDETGIYDGIASIEMFEAVRQKFWPTYFSTVRERLKPDKSATLQIITVQKKTLGCIFGQSYNITLRRWHETFNAKWDQNAAVGFDDPFRRMWNFSLTSCAATFESANCDVTQITIKRSG